MMSVILKGDIYERRPLSLEKRPKCVRFYFDCDGMKLLNVVLFRTGSDCSESGIPPSINLANGGDGEYRLVEHDLGCYGYY